MVFEIKFMTWSDYYYLIFNFTFRFFQFFITQDLRWINVPQILQITINGQQVASLGWISLPHCKILQPQSTERTFAVKRPTDMDVQSHQPISQPTLQNLFLNCLICRHVTILHTIRKLRKQTEVCNTMTPRRKHVILRNQIDYCNVASPTRYYL